GVILGGATPPVESPVGLRKKKKSLKKCANKRSTMNINEPLADLFGSVGSFPSAVQVKARKSQLLEWHPDKTAAPEAAEVTRELNLAKEVLTDPVRRAAYDWEVRIGLFGDLFSLWTIPDDLQLQCMDWVHVAPNLLWVWLLIKAPIARLAFSESCKIQATPSAQEMCLEALDAAVQVWDRLLEDSWMHVVGEEFPVWSNPNIAEIARSLDDESWMDMMQVARSLEPCLVRFRVAQAAAFPKRGLETKAETAAPPPRSKAAAFPKSGLEPKAETAAPPPLLGSRTPFAKIHQGNLPMQQQQLLSRLESLDLVAPSTADTTADTAAAAFTAGASGDSTGGIAPSTADTAAAASAAGVTGDATRGITPFLGRSGAAATKHTNMGTDIVIRISNLPIRQRLPQLESLVLQLVVPHRSSDEARQYLDNPGHDDAITRHHYKPLHAICFNVFAYQCRAPLYFAYQFCHEKCSQKLTHDQQSTAVWKKFKEIAPNRKDGSKAFRRFLGIVNKEAPKMFRLGRPALERWKLQSQFAVNYYAMGYTVQLALERYSCAVEAMQRLAHRQMGDLPMIYQS
ncbi:unnamed protein product, partial [Cladocopium goreaui]